MRALTISNGKEVVARINADRIEAVDDSPMKDHRCIFVHMAGRDGESDFTMKIPEPAASALLEWWDAEARRYGGNIFPAASETATNDGTDWVPVPGDRVALKTHSPFASPETYLGVVRGWDDTLEGYVIVAWDDGKITNEAINALQRRP